MNILVLGGRSFTDRVRLFEVLDSLAYQVGISRVLLDQESGPDALGIAWADARGIKTRSIDLSGKMGKRGATARRTGKPASEKPDLVVAFPDTESVFAKIRRAKDAGLTVIEIEESPPPAQNVFPSQFVSSFSTAG